MSCNKIIYIDAKKCLQVAVYPTNCSEPCKKNIPYVKILLLLSAEPDRNAGNKLAVVRLKGRTANLQIFNRARGRLSSRFHYHFKHFNRLIDLLKFFSLLVLFYPYKKILQWHKRILARRNFKISTLKFVKRNSLISKLVNLNMYNFKITNSKL